MYSVERNLDRVTTSRFLVLTSRNRMTFGLDERAGTTKRRHAGKSMNSEITFRGCIPELDGLRALAMTTDRGTVLSRISFHRLELETTGHFQNTR
jgi:hypothetical protein